MRLRRAQFIVLWVSVLLIVALMGLRTNEQMARDGVLFVSRSTVDYWGRIFWAGYVSNAHEAIEKGVAIADTPFIFNFAKHKGGLMAAVAIIGLALVATLRPRHDRHSKGIKTE